MRRPVGVSGVMMTRCVTAEISTYHLLTRPGGFDRDFLAVLIRVGLGLVNLMAFALPLASREHLGAGARSHPFDTLPQPKRREVRMRIPRFGLGERLFVCIQRTAIILLALQDLAQHCQSVNRS